MSLKLKTLVGLVNVALHTKTNGGIVPVSLHTKTNGGIVPVRDALDGAGTVSISLSEVPQNKVFQRSVGAANGRVHLSGSYAGAAPTGVQATVTMAVGGQVVPWTTLSNQVISGGAWSGDITVPEGGPYVVQVRCANQTDLVDFGVNQFHVGIVLLCYGQSNMQGMFDVSDAPAAALDGTYYFDGSQWVVPPAANGVRELLNGVGAATGLPVAALQAAVTGQSLAALSPGDASGYYDALIAKLTASGGDAEFVVWMQGEGDIRTPAATYTAGIDALHGAIAAVCGRAKAQIPFILAGLGRVDTAVQTWAEDDLWDAMQRTLIDTADALPHVYYSHSNADCPLSDGVHWLPSGYALAGKRYSRTISTLLGLTSGFPYITISGAATVDGVTTDVTVAHGVGADISPTSGITGFEVSGDNGGTWHIATGVRANANTVRLTHTSVTVTTARKLRYLYGGEPNNSGMVKDTSAYLSPLRPSGGMVTPTPMSVLPVPTYWGSGVVEADAQNTTRSDVSIGPAGAAQKLVIFGITANSCHDLSSATVTTDAGDAVVATALTSAKVNFEAGAYLLSAVVSASATTATFALQWAANPWGRSVVHVWTIAADDLSSLIAVDADSVRSGSPVTSLSRDISTAAGGCTLVVAINSNISASASASASDETYTKRLDNVLLGTGHYAFDASLTSAATEASTVAIDFSSAGAAAMAVVAFR